MNVSELVEKMISKPYLIEMGKGKLSKQFKCNEIDIIEARRLAKKELRNDNPFVKRTKSSHSVGSGNVLVIGDLHAPFTINGYLEFCKDMHSKYNCNEVVFIGDILDNHFSSYHESDPDGHSAGEELYRAKRQIKLWYNAFPKAKVCIGNHDALPNRKAMTAGVSKYWIKGVGEVLDTPKWEYAERFVIDDVQYVHGTGQKCRNRTKGDLMSTVQGHYHSESYIENLCGIKYKVFAMQIGCGIDVSSYAMAYGRHFPKPHINCGVVLDGGSLPIIEMMDFEKYL